MRTTLSFTLRAFAVVAASQALAAPAVPDAAQFCDVSDVATIEQLRLFLPEWCPDACIAIDGVPTPNDLALALASRDEAYPLVPLPPAVQSMAALGSCVVGMRLYRRIRRHLRAA